MNDEVFKRAKEERLKLNSVALVRPRTIPTERPPPVGEVSANFCGFTNNNNNNNNNKYRIISSLV